MQTLTEVSLTNDRSKDGSSGESTSGTNGNQQANRERRSQH